MREIEEEGICIISTIIIIISSEVAKKTEAEQVMIQNTEALGGAKMSKVDIL